MASKQPPAFLKTQTKRGLFVRTPPAIFPPIFGLLLLGLGWRAASYATNLPQGASELALGAVSLLLIFALVAYLGKFVKRPGVLAEDLRILPGLEGLASANLALMTLAAIVAPYAGQIALALLVFSGLMQLALAVAVLRRWARAKDRFWQITPVWHLVFSGFLMLAPAALALGKGALALGLLWGMMPIVALIFLASAVQFLKRVPPAPLRPLLMIHVLPLALIAILASAFGFAALALVATGAAFALAVVMAVAGVWLLGQGFSNFWGALIAPLAALASALFACGFAVPAIVVLLVATGGGVLIAKRILQDWAKGGLAIKTNAAMV